MVTACAHAYPVPRLHCAYARAYTQGHNNYNNMLHSANLLFQRFSGMLSCLTTAASTLPAHSLGTFPAAIPAIPTMSVPLCSASLAATAPASSAAGTPALWTPSLSGVATPGLSNSLDSAAVSWLLSSLVSDATRQHEPSDRRPLGPGLPTIPKSLLDKIQRWDYVELGELLPSSSVSDTTFLAIHGLRVRPPQEEAD